ncbi:GNAT family N-acetyltransferase [Fusibacter sp. JL216-2]|uniref:GNAT family N-acetyltransferase n=1 Tax=Fusibacter sp. JL216-2 TaxID=3071453 RepID=UPI003D34024D
MHSYLMIGEKIKVRKTENGDLNYIMQTEQDAMHTKFIGQNSPEEHLAMMKHPDIIHLIIEENASKSPVGYMILAGLKNIDHAVEIRRIAVSVKEQGYGSEALNLAIKMAFEEMNAHRVWLDVRVHNKIAQKAYESAGFVYEGILRDAARLGDKYESVKIYSMLRPEYEAL